MRSISPSSKSAPQRDSGRDGSTEVGISGVCTLLRRERLDLLGRIAGSDRSRRLADVCGAESCSRPVAHSPFEGNADHKVVSVRTILQLGKASEHGHARVPRVSARVGWTDWCVGHRRFPLVFSDSKLHMCNRWCIRDNSDSDIMIVADREVKTRTDPSVSSSLFRDRLFDWRNLARDDVLRPAPSCSAAAPRVMLCLVLARSVTMTITR